MHNKTVCDHRGFQGNEQTMGVVCGRGTWGTDLSNAGVLTILLSVLAERAVDLVVFKTVRCNMELHACDNCSTKDKETS